MQMETPNLCDNKERVASVLQQVLALLQKRERWNVRGLASYAVKVLGNGKCQRYIHPLEVDECVYDILDVVTYINKNVWARNNLFFLSEDTFQSPVVLGCSPLGDVDPRTHV